MKMRTHTELVQLKTFKERFDYLKLTGKVGKETFGYDRYLNQVLYQSGNWENTRNYIIVRDNGCDLAHPDFVIPDGVSLYVHHMNPITKEDIVLRKDYVFDPEFLILTTLATHNAIHYGDETSLIMEPVIRRPNDTCPWR